MTDLVRWNPFEEISSWHRDIDELFNRLVDRRLGSTSAAAWGEFFPPVETYTKDGQYIVTHILESGSVSRLREIS